MLYEINKKYYVKVGRLYYEVKIELDEKGEVVLVPLKNRLELKDEEVRAFAFQAEKDKLKQKLTQRKHYETINKFN